MTGAMTLANVTTKRHPVRAQHRVAVGIDIGKLHDFTTLAVAERRVIPLDEWEWRNHGHYHQLSETHTRLRALKRLPLGVDYLEQVAICGDMIARVGQYADEVEVAIDATGVGEPIADMFDRIGVNPTRVYITGEANVKSLGSNKYRVPRLHLISQLEALLHASDLKIAAQITENPNFREELADLQRIVTQSGHVRIEHRSGKHDDLVLAVAIAIWKLLYSRGRAERVRVKGI